MTNTIIRETSEVHLVCVLCFSAAFMLCVLVCLHVLMDDQLKHPEDFWGSSCVCISLFRACCACLFIHMCIQDKVLMNVLRVCMCVCRCVYTLYIYTLYTQNVFCVGVCLCVSVYTQCVHTECISANALCVHVRVCRWVHTAGMNLSHEIGQFICMSHMCMKHVTRMGGSCRTQVISHTQMRNLSLRASHITDSKDLEILQTYHVAVCCSVLQLFCSARHVTHSKDLAVLYTQHVAVCCSYVAAQAMRQTARISRCYRRSTLQCVAVYCSVLQPEPYDTQQGSQDTTHTTCCSVLWCVVARAVKHAARISRYYTWSMLQCVAVCWSARHVTCSKNLEKLYTHTHTHNILTDTRHNILTDTRHAFLIVFNWCV